MSMIYSKVLLRRRPTLFRWDMFHFWNMFISRL